MSEPISNPGRPVPLITTIFVLVLFALFLLVARYFYTPTIAPAFVATPENYAKDQDVEWRSSRETRQKTLQETRHTDRQRLTSYNWVDQKAGVVQLPIERAMELTAQEIAAKQPAKANRAPQGGTRAKQ